VGPEFSAQRGRDSADRTVSGGQRPDWPDELDWPDDDGLGIPWAGDVASPGWAGRGTGVGRGGGLGWGAEAGRGSRPGGRERPRVLWLVVVAVLAAGAGAGAALPFTGSSPAASSSPSPGSSPGAATPGGGNGGTSGGLPPQGGGIPGEGTGTVQTFVAGPVTAVSATSISIGGAGGRSVTAAITSSTRFGGKVTSTRGISVGDEVSAQVEQQGNGRPTAVEISYPASQPGGPGGP
jgi:Domain of unknown function (DUF5666)